MHKNNINLLRLLAALQVVLSHMIGHLELASSDHPLVLVIRMFPGVPVFFLLSGYLIFQAWERDRDIYKYLINRALRIYPALWVAFLVTVVMLLVVEGFDGTAKETVIWIVAQLSVFQFFNPEFLRDFGVGVVNGALWSIPVEIQFYLVLPVFAFLFQKSFWLIGFLFIFVIINFVFFQNETGSIYSKLFSVTVFPYLAIFFVGILFAKYERLLLFACSMSPLLFLLLYVGLYWLVVMIFGYSQSGRTLSPFVAPVLALLIFSIAFKKKINIGWLEKNDLSYGIYLYHMIFINLALYYELQKMAGIFVVLVCTIFFAISSWILVEKPALALKRRFFPQKILTKNSRERAQ